MKESMSSLDRIEEFLENISYLGIYNSRLKLDLTDRNLDDLRLRTQKICFRIHQCIK
jgi:hypothetical protein